jgi:hypothetical protein
VLLATQCLPGRRTGYFLRRSVSPSQTASRGESSTLPLISFLTTYQRHSRSIANISSAANEGPWHHRGKSDHGTLIPQMTPYTPISIVHSISASSTPSVQPPLLPASSPHSPSLLDRVSADLIPFATHLHGIFKFCRSSDKSDRYPVRTVICATDCRTRADCHRRKGVGINSHEGVQRRWATGIPLVSRQTRRHVVGGNENVPVEILRVLSDWFAVLEERTTVPGTSLGAMVGAISALEDAASGVSDLYTYIPPAWLMSCRGGENTDNAAPFVRRSRPVYIEFFV